MTTGSILLATALFILVGLYIFRPILLRTSSPPLATERDRLLEEKEIVLSEIKSLEFDLETGKIESADFQRQRTRLVQHAANLLRQIDDLPADQLSIDDQIEQAIAAYRQQEN